MTTVRVEKRKWDGSVSAMDNGEPIAVPGDISAWLIHAGSRRERPRSGEFELIARDELWVAVPGQWWVLCGYLDADRSFNGYKVHASAPFVAPSSADEIVWIDLDLDFEVSGSEVEIEDEAQFHDHARTMGYPDEVVRGAWSGISTIAARYTTGEWPFDGSMLQWVGGA
jgi:protein associated with RNAse G/E